MTERVLLRHADRIAAVKAKMDECFRLRQEIADELSAICTEDAANPELEFQKHRFRRLAAEAIVTSYQAPLRKVLFEIEEAIGYDFISSPASSAR